MPERLPIAIATCEELADLPPSEQILVAALADAGIQARAAVWSSPAVNWQDFGAVVIRSCWDYHLRSSEFLEWISRLDRRKIPLINSPPLVRWNLDKRYLRDLSNRGIVIPGSLWLAPGESIDLSDLVVVKPLISASAYRTERRSSGSVRGPMLIQEYLPAIELEGEWSLLYFGGAFSHAVRKRPREGDFRVQKEFGGSIDPADPPAEIRAAAERAMAALSQRPVFARVDLVQHYLMELELIEPELFLAQAPGAAQRLVSAILTAIGY